MCLAVPGRIVTVTGNRATVELAGNTLTVDVSLIEAPAPGDWVVVHAGFALERLDEAAALETLALAREFDPGRAPGGRRP